VRPLIFPTTEFRTTAVNIKASPPELEEVDVGASRDHRPEDADCPAALRQSCRGHR
jgi:hypothetical protein